MQKCSFTLHVSCAWSFSSNPAEHFSCALACIHSCLHQPQEQDSQSTRFYSFSLFMFPLRSILLVPRGRGRPQRSANTQVMQKRFSRNGKRKRKMNLLAFSEERAEREREKETEREHPRYGSESWRGRRRLQRLASMHIMQTLSCVQIAKQMEGEQQ